jgi:hypothetical protein
VRKLALVLALVAPLQVQAQQTGDLVRFVACPIYRDTDSGRKSGCWLADDVVSGTRYDVSQGPYKPDWSYEILVEGRVSAEPPTPCGALVLDPVRTSRLTTPCTRHMIPAEGFPGRKFSLPRRNNDPIGVPRPTYQPPFTERTFTTYFEFGRDFIVYQYDDWLLDQAANWIRQAKPRKLIVTGFAATDPVVISGRTLAEPAELANSRAEMIAQSLRRLVPGIPIETRAETSAKPIVEAEADGIPGQSQRRAEIRAEF